MNTRSAYRALSYITLAKAASRGPTALLHSLVRRQAHRLLARALR